MAAKGGSIKTKARSTLQIIEEQVRRWQVAGREEPRKVPNVPVITVSREPGSGGKLVAQGLAARLDLELFHQELISALDRRFGPGLHAAPASTPSTAMAL